ncbi:MAG: SDR family NAD(P)-dependent oxidoreductase, partial [Nitriliruptorales bacterium]|nr:SDR family NAD(P)-dependent oxidoreductase [Nitriliruptorales bacterium]
MRRMWSKDTIPDQRGRVVVVTGANAGLGHEVARLLAARGATVVMAARNQERARAARDAIVAAVPDAQVELRELDLASLASVRACGEAIAADHERIDVLVNNAGLMGIPRQQTADGFEMQLGVNHLGHFVLTRRLLPRLLAAPAGRVVSVTSFGRWMGPTLREKDPHFTGWYNAWVAYGQSKQANHEFSIELQRRLQAANAPAISVVAHPGLAHTDLQRRSVRETHGGLSQRFWAFAARNVGMEPPQAALSVVRAAAETAAKGGELYGPQWLTFGDPVRRRAIGRPRRA